MKLSIASVFSAKEWIYLLLFFVPFVQTEDNITLEIKDFTSSDVELSCKYESDINVTDAFFRVDKGRKSCIYQTKEMCQLQNDCKFVCLANQDHNELPFLVNLDGTCGEAFNIRCKVGNTNQEHILNLEQSLQLTSLSDPPEILVNGGLPVEASCNKIQITCTVRNACQKTKLDITGNVPMEPISVTHTNANSGRYTTTAKIEAIFRDTGNYTVACKETGKSDTFSRNVTFEVTSRTNQTDGEGISFPGSSQQNKNDQIDVSATTAIILSTFCVALFCTTGVLSIMYVLRRKRKRQRKKGTSDRISLLQKSDRYKKIEREIEQLTTENISQKAPEILNVLEEGDTTYAEEGYPIIHQLIEKTEKLYHRPHFAVLFTVMYQHHHESAAVGKEDLTEIIWKQLKSFSINNDQERREYIQKLKNFTHLDVDLCSRLLWRYTEHDEMKWNSHFLDMLTFLVKEGADPFEYHDGINAFTLVLREPSLQNLQQSVKSSLSKFFEHVLNPKTESVLNDVVKSIPSVWFRENSSHFTGIQEVLAEQYNHINFKSDRALRNHEDKDGRTPLHNLMIKVFTEVSEKNISDDRLWYSMKDLITPKNINLKDKDKVTPYFWICSEVELSKDPHVDADNLKKFWEEMDRHFKNIGATDEGADIGMKVVWEKKMEHLLKRLMTTHQTMAFHLKEKTGKEFIQAWGDEVHRLASTIKYLISKGCGECLKDLPAAEEFKKFTRDHVEIMNRTMLEISSSIMEIFIDKCNAQQIFDSFMKIKRTYKIYYPTWVEIIKRCIHKGAAPKKKDIETLITKRIFKVEEWLLVTIECVESLIKAYRKGSSGKPVEIYLNFLQNQYCISKDLRDVAGSVIRCAYMKLGKCKKSRSVVNTLLFLRKDDSANTIRTCFLDADMIIPENQTKIDLTEKEQSENGKNLVSDFVKRNNNLFKRNILHLAAIFCHDEKVINCIPKEMVEKYINKPDLHGCMPLHTARLHNNVAAIHLFESSNATVAEDNFGRTPDSLQASDTAVDEEYKNICQSILTSNSSVFEKMKFMLVSAEECVELEGKFTKLFNKVVEKDTQITFANVLVGGSMREKLKVGRLDEFNLQIFTSSRRLFAKTNARQQITDLLVKKISAILPQEKHLRLTAVGSQWKFIWEKGSREADPNNIEIVLDIQLFSKEYHVEPTIPQRQMDMLENAPPHHERIYLKLDEFGKPSSLNNTMCQYEWDILDNLPLGSRLGILICKIFLEALEITSDLPERVITAQVIKTTAFWLTSGQMPVKIGKNHADVIFEKWAAPPKLKYSAEVPDWVTEEDLNKYGQEGRIWAVKIFETIRYIAKNCGVLLDSFLLSESQECYPLKPWQLYEAIYTCEKCLERLREDVFFGEKDHADDIINDDPPSS